MTITGTTYLTLAGDVLDLAELTDAEQWYFEQCHAEYTRGMPWADFGNEYVYGRSNPLLTDTGGLVTAAVWRHPLFQAARDLNHRLGIQQGEIGRGGSVAADSDPLADEWLPVADAAAGKGVAPNALHHAIKQGKVIARPAKEGGSWLVVSRRSLDRWQPSKAHQEAKRRGRATESA